MERIGFKSHSHEAAEAWDRQQQAELTPWERLAALRELQLRFYGRGCPDIRESERRR